MRGCPSVAPPPPPRPSSPSSLPVLRLSLSWSTCFSSGVSVRDDDVRPRGLRSTAAADAAQGRDVLQAMVGHSRGLRAHHHARIRYQVNTFNRPLMARVLNESTDLHGTSDNNMPQYSRR